MGKTTISITIDTELLNQAKKLGINRSQSLENWLRTLVKMVESDFGGLDLEKKKEEVGKLQNEAVELQVRIREGLEQISSFERLLADREAALRLEELQRLERQKVCQLCGSPLLAKQVKTLLKDGCLVHANCLLERENYERLKKEGKV